jgi:hypothetical protein
MKLLFIAIMLITGCDPNRRGNEVFEYSVKCYQRDMVVFSKDGVDNWEISYSPRGYVFYKNKMPTVVTDSSCVIERKIRVEK